MRFSIIVPVYNAEKYLEKCLSSVLGQDCRDFEVLLVNDGSKDSSGEICMAHADRYTNIRYEYQENAGPSSARNRGIEKAAGEYLLFLDADDEMEAGSLRMLDGIIETHHPDAVISSEKIRSREGAQPVEDPLLLDPEKIHAGKASALKELSEKRFCLMTHKIVVKRTIVMENGLRFNTDYRVGEDILMMAKTLCRCSNFRLNDVPYYIYNYNDTSIMHTIRFDRIWQTTGICGELYRQAMTAEEAEKQLLYTTISMLLIGFTKYYRGFTPEQKKQTGAWLKENAELLNAVAGTHPATGLARKVIGSKNAFLLAGYVVSAGK